MRTLIIALALASVAGAAAAQSTDYPPCRHRGDDHCRVTESYSMRRSHHDWREHRHERRERHRDRHHEHHDHHHDEHR